LYLNLEHIIN